MNKKNLKIKGVIDAQGNGPVLKFDGQGGI
jgi:hypothetical protein